MRRIKILGTGSFLPSRTVKAEELDEKLKLSSGWAQKKSGATTRQYVSSETPSQMGARAAREALDRAGLEFSDLDALICTSGTMEQAIPCTAALIQKEMGEEDTGTPCFDINATCLSFVFGLDTVSYMIDAGRFDKVLFVSTEATSTAINWQEKESAVLIGDGAAAAVVGRTPEGENSRILNSGMETYSSGADFVEFPGCGTKMMADEEADPRDPKYRFRMQGTKVFKLANQILPRFFRRMLEPLKYCPGDLDLVIPHQASALALKLMEKRLELKPGQFFINIQNRGNMVSASIPTALHEAIIDGRVKRGDRIALLGTSAGFSVGGMVLEY